MIGYCGLDCGQCEAFIATQNNDDALRARVAVLWSKLSGAPIKPEHINCTGCKSSGTKTFYCEQLCEIRKCAIKRSLNACAECPDYPCSMLNRITEEARRTKAMRDELWNN